MSGYEVSGTDIAGLLALGLCYLLLWILFLILAAVNKKIHKHLDLNVFKWIGLQNFTEERISIWDTKEAGGKVTMKLRWIVINNW